MMRNERWWLYPCTHLQHVQNHYSLSQRPTNQSVFSLRLKTLISIRLEETHRHRQLNASLDGISNKLGLLNTFHPSGIQIMSVITFCPLDTVLHIVICSLQYSSCCSHSGLVFTDQSCILKRLWWIYPWVSYLVQAFPTRWPTIQVLVRFNYPFKY